MIRGEATATIKGVTPDDVFDFVLDPAQYTKADTKMVWVTKLADTPDGMLAREDGRFMGKFPGSVVTRYRWKRPGSIDVTLEHGVPERLHAWFEIDAVDGGTRVRHVEEIEMGHGLLGRLHDLVAGKWFAKSVELEVAEIARLLRDGQRGRRLHALDPTTETVESAATKPRARAPRAKATRSRTTSRANTDGANTDGASGSTGGGQPGSGSSEG